MTVSIIIPCYNCNSFIEETLNSVVNQSYENFEIIAIDDCSTDNTLDKLESFAKREVRLKVYKNDENIGVAYTRNRGVELASGEYVAFLDADDVWEVNKLKKQVDKIIEDNSIDLCYTAYSLYNHNMENVINNYSVPNKVFYKDMLYENYIGLSTVIMKKKLFTQYEMSNKYIHEDYVLWLKLLKNNCKFIGIDEFLVKYRVFENSRNSSKIKSLIGRMKILRYEEGINIIALFKYIFVYSIRGVSKYKKIRK